MERLAHVGSEVERAIRSDEAGCPARWEAAHDRALELFDLWRETPGGGIIAGRRSFGPGRCCRLFLGEGPPSGSAAGLRRYFLYFAIAARNRR